MRAFPRFRPVVLGLFVLTQAHAADLSRPDIEKAVAGLRERAMEEMKTTGIPGLAFAVVFQGEVIASEGLGEREAGTDTPVDADTVFQLASVSKPIGSTVIAALVGRGVVTWDTRVSDLDPGFEMLDPWVTREVTLRDLYGHRSGLPGHAGDLLEDIGYSREEVLRRLRFQPPSSSFRAGYAYTNFGLTEAAMAAARAAGNDWETLSDELLYAPLGMASTSSRFADFEKQENRARGHQLIDGKWTHVEQRQPDAQTPAGGVSSSVNDLTRWLRMLLDGGTFEGRQIVATDALAETHQPLMLTGFSPIDGTPGFYGLGWNVRYDTAGRLRLSHSGAFAMGAATFVGLIPSKKLGIVILTNAAPLGVPEALGEAFFEQALTGTVTHDWSALFRKAFVGMTDAGRSRLPDAPPQTVAPAAPAKTYAGVYANDFFGSVTVVEKDGGLILQLGPQPLALPLEHWDRDTFIYHPVGENAAGRSAVIFTAGTEGQASRVWIENLDAHGLGTFLRQVPGPQQE